MTETKTPKRLFKDARLDREMLELEEIIEGLTFVVVRLNRWGRGHSIAEASKRCGGSGRAVAFITNDPKADCCEMTGAVTFERGKWAKSLGGFTTLNPASISRG